MFLTARHLLTLTNAPYPCTQLQLLVRAYQVRGHRIATLDPLGILNPDLDGNTPQELTIEHYGWKDSDLDREMQLGPGLLPNFVSEGRERMTIREVIDAVKRIYCECHDACFNKKWRAA